MRFRNPPPPRLKKVQGQGSITLCSANVTSYNTAVSSWLAARLGRGTQVFAIQETHQTETKTKQTQRQLKSWGLEGFYLPAEATGCGGTAGGQFIVAARTVGASTLASYSLGGNGWCGILLELAGCKLALFSIYLRTGEGLFGSTNCQLLGALRGCLKSLADGLPWLVVGDWNAEPSALGESDFLRAVSGAILDTGEPTYSTSASALDYAVAHKSLAGLCSIQVTWDVPWRPHAAVVLRINIGHLPLRGATRMCLCCQDLGFLGAVLKLTMYSCALSWSVLASSCVILNCHKFSADGWPKLRVG